MGFVKKAVSSVFGGGGSDAASRAASNSAAASTQAAKIQAKSAKEALEEVRRQFDISQEAIAPFAEAGVDALPLLQEGMTTEGLDARLARIMNTDTFGNVYDERRRAMEGQLAAGGLTRSGTALDQAAQLPIDLALGLENLLSSRAGDLTRSGLSAVTGTAQLGADSSRTAAQLLQNAGNASAQGVLNAGNATSQGILQAQQADAAASQNLLNTAATLGSIFFSDPNLKTNIEVIGTVGPLTLYMWDWIEETETLKLIDEGFTMGFMTDEVKKVYPELVHTVGGFDCIDYPSLLSQVENDIAYQEAA